jgi:hypothetical protein
VIGSALQLRRVAEVVTSNGCVQCRFEDGATAEVPGILARFLQSRDQLRSLGANAEFLVQRPTGRRCQQILHATIGYVGLPKSGKNGDAFVRAELPNCPDGPKALFLSAEALRRYFYLLDGDTSQSLYRLLRVPEAATLDQLRFAWRMRSLELQVSDSKARDLSCVERAFNVLAHPDLRNCYDAICKNQDAAPLFPYGGFGSILVDGHLSDDEDVFFADRILAYKPEMTSRKVTLLLRRCEFFEDRVVCRDPRRKLEVWLDSNVLPGLGWDLTWNHWKHWLRTRIEVQATFVHAGKYRLYNGKWILRKWQAALPSRLQVHAPSNVAEDLQHAQTIHALLGEYADLVQHIRNQCEKLPIEYTQVERWFGQVNASAHLKPHHVTWRPDYEPYYFNQLRKRSRTWFLFRDEYLFVWRNALIAEIPEPGHATYLFAKPDNLDDFLERYAKLTREDIRRNRDNLATALGFVGRVVRGKRKKRWLADVLKHAGEKADYIEAFD